MLLLFVGVALELSLWFKQGHFSKILEERESQMHSFELLSGLKKSFSSACFFAISSEGKI